MTGFLLNSLILLTVMAAPRAGAQPVAIAGTDTIFLDEYRAVYVDLIKKPGVFDSEKLRESVLDDLIDTHLLAAEARASGFFPDSLMNRRSTSFRKKILREIHYGLVIRKSVSVTEAETEEAYQFTQEQRQVSHLFFKTRQAADSALQRLKAGESWNLLAALTFRDDRLGQTGGDLGWVYWDQFGYDLGMAIFRAPIDSVTGPVKSEYGWHLIKVTSWKKNPLLTRRQYELAAAKTRIQLISKIGEKRAQDYVTSLAKTARIVLFPEVVKKFQAGFDGKLNRLPGKLDDTQDSQLSEQELSSIRTGLETCLDEVVATVNGDPVTVADLVESMVWLPYSVLYSGFGKTLDYALRDELLTRDALSMGFDRSDTLTVKLRVFENQMLSAEMRRILLRSTRVTEEEVQDYFRNNESRFAGTSYDQVRESLKKEVLNQKRTTAVSRFLKEKRDQISLRRNPEVIHSWYRSVIEK